MNGSTRLTARTGVTLVELVVALMLVGLLAGFAYVTVPRRRIETADKLRDERDRSVARGVVVRASAAADPATLSVAYPDGRTFSGRLGADTGESR